MEGNMLTLYRSKKSISNGRLSICMPPSNVYDAHRQVKLGGKHQ